MASSRVARGRRTQKIAAAYYQEKGVKDAEAVEGAVAGRDIRKVPWLAPEVKARRDFNPKSWMKQARKNGGVEDFPIVIMRPDGMGEESVADWPVFMRFEDHIKLCRWAGLW